MADTYYAWSKFKLDVNEWGQVNKWLMPGEKVTQDMLKVSDEDWQGLIDSGAVRTDKYPDVSSDVPPVSAMPAEEVAAAEAESPGGEATTPPPASGSTTQAPGTAPATGEKK